MTTVPGLTGKKLMTALRRAGFEILRVKGSHHFLKHADGRLSVVPVHAGETLGPGLSLRGAHGMLAMTKETRHCDINFASSLLQMRSMVKFTQLTE
jgi:predicted RNA binding protein YcfA (HicA-like mRNA interferase family)